MANHGDCSWEAVKFEINPKNEFRKPKLAVLDRFEEKRVLLAVHRRGKNAIFKFQNMYFNSHRYQKAAVFCDTLRLEVNLGRHE